MATSDCGPRYERVDVIGEAIFSMSRRSPLVSPGHGWASVRHPFEFASSHPPARLRQEPRAQADRSAITEDMTRARERAEVGIHDRSIEPMSARLTPLQGDLWPDLRGGSSTDARGRGSSANCSSGLMQMTYPLLPQTHPTHRKQHQQKFS
jgi:hypothetical protein